MDAKEWPAHSHRRCKLIEPATGYRQSLRSGGQRLPRQTCESPGSRAGISDHSGILPRIRPAAFVAPRTGQRVADAGKGSSRGSEGGGSRIQFLTLYIWPKPTSTKGAVISQKSNLKQCAFAVRRCLPSHPPVSSAWGVYLPPVFHVVLYINCQFASK